MTLDLERLRALALAATPGPWTYSPMTETKDPEIGAANGSRVAALVCADITKANSAFIGAANPAAVLDLLDQLDRAVQHQDDLRSQLARAAAQVKGLLNERNNLIIERNAALVRAIKLEHPSSGRAGVLTRSGDFDEALKKAVAANPNPWGQPVLIETCPNCFCIHQPNSGDPDDPLDDVLPLPVRRAFDRPDVERLAAQPLPPLDLADSEGGEND